jgi:hypothetical protein
MRTTSSWWNDREGWLRRVAAQVEQCLDDCKLATAVFPLAWLYPFKICICLLLQLQRSQSTDLLLLVKPTQHNPQSTSSQQDFETGPLVVQVPVGAQLHISATYNGDTQCVSEVLRVLVQLPDVSGQADSSLRKGA